MKNRWGRQVFYLYFSFPKAQMKPLFSSRKKDRWGAFETDEGGHEKQLTYFLSDWHLKKYSVVLVMYSWVQGFLQQYLSKYEYMYSWILLSTEYG